MKKFESTPHIEEQKPNLALATEGALASPEAGPVSDALESDKDLLLKNQFIGLFQKVLDPVNEILALAAAEREKQKRNGEALKTLKEASYISPERVKEIFENLLIDITIPDDEINYMNVQLMKVNLGEVRTECAKMKEHSENYQAPQLIAIPRVFTTAQDAIFCNEQGKDTEYKTGSTIPLTIANMKKIFADAKKAGKPYKDVWITDYCSAELWKQTTSDGLLTAYSSTCIKGSKSKKYSDQLAWRTQQMGSGYETKAPGNFLAFLLQYLNTNGQSKQFTSDYMRMDSLDRDGDPLNMYASGDDLLLFYSPGSAAGNGGLGFSRNFFR